jgi:hypothetical protein
MDWEEKINELEEGPRSLVKYLATVRTLRREWKPAEFVYAGSEDFVLQHGEWFELCPWTKHALEGAPKSCYAHSARLCAENHGLAYVEGFALYSRELLLPLPHAWVTNAAGELIDGTWRNAGVAYLGVRFPLKQVLRAMKKDGAVLDCPQSKFAIYRQRFQAT